MSRTRPTSGKRKHGLQLSPRRVASAAALAVAAYFSLAATSGNVLRKASPELAHTLAPNNGDITATLSAQQFTARPSPEPDAPAAQLARNALFQDATAVEALTVLGFQAQLRGNQAEADSIFSLGTRLSRRELRPQLWAIEEAVSRGDIAGALKHYDIALRTSADAQVMLYPILASALTEPKVRGLLLRILQQEPNWTASFLSHASAHASSPSAVARFIGEAGAAKVPLPLDETARADLVAKLVEDEQYGEAWRYYTTFRPDAVRNRSRDPNFALASGTRAAFDWTTTDDAALIASILQAEDGGALDFAAPPGRSGILATQLQLLPAGSYRLQGRSAGIEQPPRSRPFWVLNCVDGRELGKVMLPNSSQAGGVFSDIVTVPQNCPVQSLALVAQSSSDIGGVSGQVTQVELTPARQRS